MDTPHGVLTAAAALIAEHGHCRPYDALDYEGRPVLPHVLTARERSATGAILAAAREASGYSFIGALRSFAVATGAKIDNDAARRIRWDDAPGIVGEWCTSVWHWEDVPGRTPEHVLEAFERAKEDFSERTGK